MKKLLTIVISSLITLSLYAQSSVPSQCEDVMLQGFYWDSYRGRSSNGSTRWATLYKQAQDIGRYFDLVWLPPSSLSVGGTGYTPQQYSNQNSTWGTRAELEQLISAFHSKGTKVIADVVINHIVGESTWCDFMPEDFDQYGLFQPNGSYICNTDEMNAQETMEYAGDCWGTATGAQDDGENYFGARDWAHQNAQVQNMFKAYSRWLINVMHYDGFRYDYGLGYHTYHINDYNQASNPYISIAEFWTGLDETKNRIQDAQMNTMSLDFQTKYSIIDAIAGWNYIGRGAGLIGDDFWKKYAVTFIDNHDMFQRNDQEFAGMGNSLTPALKFRLLNANALILSMPGVPCVFYPHWNMYKVEIGKMIDARHSAGIHSESEVRDEYWDNDGTRNTGYQATIVGKNGWLVLRLGTKANGQTLGEGWRLMASGYNISLYGPNESYEMWVYCTDTASYINNDTTYATVVEDQFSISTNCDSLGGMVTGSGTYYYYDTCVIEAIPNEGFRFVQWSDGNTDNPRQLFVTQDSTFTAEFAIPCQPYYSNDTVYLCALDTMPWHGRMIRHSGRSAVTELDGHGYMETYLEEDTMYVDSYVTEGGCDSIYTLYVHFSPRYYSFIVDTLEWDEPCYLCEQLTHTSPDTYEGYIGLITREGCDSLQRWYITIAPRPQYTITLDVNNTKFGSVDGAGTFPKDTIVQIWATPNKGYLFNRWSDGNTDNPRQITVTQNETYTAIFLTKVCSWEVESNDMEMGTIVTIFNEPYYTYGTQITVEASPNSGYKFVKWNDGKKYNPYRFSLLDDKYLLAIFVAEEEEQDTTTVQPTTTTATFTWPFVEGGYSYSLTIYLDEACTIVLCTINFDQDGRLISIVFSNGAPRRNMQEDGFTYTVSGLDANTTYYYKMETKDEDNKLINTDEGTFETTNDGTGIMNVSSDNPRVTKLLRNGQILILRGDRTYTITGQEVR